MFIFSFKLTKAHCAVLFLCIVCIVMVLCMSFLGNKEQPVFGQTPKNLSAATNDERIDFLKQFGWEVGNEPLEELDILIPEEFNAVYERYNALQREENGLDLKKYKGKAVVRYTYEVTNYPNETDRVYANMLVYEGKVIGGDISSAALDGFMHGFSL